MMRALPLALLLACGCVSAQPVYPADTPVRDAHIVTVTQERGAYVFRVEGQPTDVSASLTPGGTLVVAATDGLQVLVVANDRGVYSHDSALNRPLVDGPLAVWIDGRSHDEVGVMRVTSEIERGARHSVDVSILVCDRAVGYDECGRWVAATPRTRPDGPGGLDAGLRLDIIGGPTRVYAPAPPPGPPPVRPVRE